MPSEPACSSAAAAAAAAAKDEESKLDSTDTDENLDDEEEEEHNFTLGFLKTPGDPRVLLRHQFPSKAGGAPAWLDPVELPPENTHSCGFCGDPLRFLLQVYAPISDKDTTFHRTLFVFICPSMSCLMQDQHNQGGGVEGTPRSLKVFRCQLPRVNSFYSSEPVQLDDVDKSSTAGAALCCWCGTWKGEKVCSRCRKAFYCSRKHQASHWTSSHRNDCMQLATSAKDSAPVACHSHWPEYEIVDEDECVFDCKMSEDSNSGMDVLMKQNEMNETYNLWMDKFEADDDKRIWATFQERIAKAPDQILRYCRDMAAKPLWPLLTGRPSESDIPRCRYCHGPLCFEFQIMPQLYYYIHAKDASDSLDWATIVVYTCLASCELSLSYKEEFAWVQLDSVTTTS